MISADIPADMKRCIGPCGLILPLEDFYAHPHSPKGRASTCKKCVMARVRVRREEEKRADQAQSAAGNRPPHPMTDEEFLAQGFGTEPERRAALAAILARAAMARAAPAAADELTIRLELATTILDRMANGGALQEAVAQARSFVMIERSCGRYRRKIK